MKFFFLVFVCLVSSLGYTQLKPDVIFTKGHSELIINMTISSNGRFLASSAVDKEIIIWDMARGMEFRSIIGMDGRVNQLSFSSNNIHLAGASSSNELFVWDVITGKEILKKEVGNARGMGFSKNGKQLYYSNTESQLEILNITTGSTQVLYEGHVVDLIVDNANGLVYVYNIYGHIIKIKGETGAIIEEYKILDKLYYSTTAPTVSKEGKYIAFAFEDEKLRLFNTEKGEFDYISKYKEASIQSITFDKEKPIIYYSLYTNKVVLFNYETFEIVEQLKVDRTNGLMFGVQHLAPHPEGELVLLSSGSEIALFDLKRKEISKRISGKVEGIKNMAYDPTGRYLVTATKTARLIVWDLTLNKVVHSIPGFFPCQFTPDGKSIIAMTMEMTGSINLGLFDIKTGNLEKSYDTNMELIQSIAISEDGQVLSGAGFQNIIRVWDVVSTEKITEMSGHTGGVLSLDFHPTKPWIVSGALDQTARIWDYTQSKEIMKFEEQTISISSVKFSPDGSQLATAAWDQTIYLRSTTDWSVEHVLKGHVNVINSIDYSGDSHVLISGAGNGAVGSSDNSINCWDTKTGKILCKFDKDQKEVIKIIADQKIPRFYAASADGTIKYFDHSSCELVATYLAVNEEDFMVYTPDSYYMASKNALEAIAFRVEDKLVPLERFDIHLNRPDIIATRIGKSSKALIRAYNYIYKKKLKRLNLEEGSIKMDYKLPQIINETEYDLITTAPFQKLWIKAWDDNYNLKSVHIYVNNVPLFGREGLLIQGNEKEFHKEIEIPLIAGVNKIEISCMNSIGVESLYESVQIVRNSDPVKHDLYIVSIGVSDYKDSRFALEYPAKDAQDILNKFKESEKMYTTIYEKLLINEDVTIENIVGLSSFFSNCTHEDFVVIFVAGHGILNVDYDYYFGTYDIDFNKPKERGLPYDKFSILLSNIKAYKKLLIMDTCHSGELDKDEIEEEDKPDTEQGDIKFRSTSTAYREKEGIGFDNSIEYAKELYADLRKGSGATVISSAGGTEFAIEGGEWDNGLFTSVFIEAMGSSSKIGNFDNVIYLKEIRQYVNSKVKEISKGKQIPTAREDNINIDYIIFEE